MIVFYDLDNKKILRTEEFTMQPIFPIGTKEEQEEFYKSENVGFESVKEMGMDIFDYDLTFDNGIFTGIKLKEGANK